MNLFSDILLHIERREGTSWRRESSGEYVDRTGKSTRALAWIPNLAGLERAGASIAFTLRELRDVDWTASRSHDGCLPFRPRDLPSFYVEEAFIDWVKNEPRRPKNFYDGMNAGEWLAMEDEARAALDGRSVDEAERLLLAEAPEGSRLFVNVSWTMTHAETNAAFLEWIETVVAPLGAPEDVRVVFENA